MYKIAIADDQEFVRSSMAKIIDKQKDKFQVCALYGNGQELMDDIDNSNPNIILTDIKMPIMNGIEIAKTVSQKYPFIKTIILSGYGDFDFAQQAIKYGVFDYLLKPCKEEELIHALQIAADKLNEEKNNNQLRNWYTNSYVDNLPNLRQQAIISLLYDYKPIVGSYDLYGLKHFSPPFAVWIISININQSVFKEKESDILLYGCCNILDEMMGNITNKELFACNNNIVCLSSLDQASEDEITISVEKATTLINQIFNCNTQFSKGCKVFSLYDCGTSYRDALEKMQLLKKSSKTSTDNLVIINAVEYIKKNYSLNIGLEDIAKNTYITPSYLSSLFALHLGVNFTVYLTKIRIENACELLKNPINKIGDIAKKVGYTDYRYFNYVFKKMTGSTPTEYRRNPS